MGNTCASVHIALTGTTSAALDSEELKDLAPPYRLRARESTRVDRMARRLQRIAVYWTFTLVIALADIPWLVTVARI